MSEHSAGLRLHPRTMKVQAAEAELEILVWSFQSENELTIPEIQGALIRLVHRCQVLMLRVERHGTTEIKADEAGEGS